MVYRYALTLQWSEIDQAFIVEVPELPGCAADGETYQEAVQTKCRSGDSRMDYNGTGTRAIYPRTQRPVAIRVNCSEQLESRSSRDEGLHSTQPTGVGAGNGASTGRCKYSNRSIVAHLGPSP